MTDPFHAHGCTCPSGRASAAAALAGEPVPLCQVHDATAIAQREREQQRTAAAEDAAKLRIVTDQVLNDYDPARTEPPSCSCGAARDLIGAAFVGDVPSCAVHRPATVATAPEDDGTARSVIGRIFAASAPTTDPTGDTPPPAAA